MSDMHRRAGGRGWLPALLTAVALGGTSSPSASQEPTSEPGELPRDFVDLLLGRDIVDPRSPAYLLGEMPRPLPGVDSFAAEGRVVGTVTWPNRSRSAIAVSRDVQSARERIEAVAREAGWTDRPAPPERRGFVPAQSADPLRGFCYQPGNSMLQIRAHRGPADSSYVVLDFRPGRGRGFCDPEVARRAREAYRFGFEMPTLRPPDGLHVDGTGTSIGTDEASTRAMLYGEAALADLAAEFESQLGEQGWTVEERLAGEDNAVLSADRPADDGGTLELTVLVRRIADDRNSLAMWVVRSQ